MKQYLPTICLRSFFIALFCASVGAGLATAEPLAPGDSFPGLKGMQDQHEAAYAMPAAVEHVAVAFTMSVGKSANKALAEQGAYQQEKRFTAEASHEFRTPLSIIRLQTERLLNHEELMPEDRSSVLSEQMNKVSF